MTTQFFSFATRTLFNALINGNRGYQAPYPSDDAAVSAPARAALDNGGPKVLSAAPAAALTIRVVPQAADFTHVANLTRMLPAWSPESTSGGWVALPYAFDPPPSIPDIILPQAVWGANVGEVRVSGLDSSPSGALLSLTTRNGVTQYYPTSIASSSDVLNSGGV